MRKYQIPIICALAAVVIYALASQLNTAKGPRPVGTDNVPVGVAVPLRRPLPDYRLTNLDRQELPAGELSRGRVLLVYMTTGCKPCVEETEIISRLREAAPSELRIYGVSFESPAQVATFARDTGANFPVLLDLNAQLARSLDIHYFPSTYLIEDGVITKVWRGVTRDEAELYRQLNSQ